MGGTVLAGQDLLFLPGKGGVAGGRLRAESPELSMDTGQRHRMAGRERSKRRSTVLPAVSSLFSQRPLETSWGEQKSLGGASRSYRKAKSFPSSLWLGLWTGRGGWMDA